MNNIQNKPLPTESSQFDPPPITQNGHPVLPTQISLFSGPIPPPECLEKYERFLPGSANRIFELAEGEAHHRRAQQVKELNHRIEFEMQQIAIAQKNQQDNAILARVGQFLAFTLGTVGIGGGIFCASIDQPLAASVIAGGGLAALITPFLTNHQNAK